MRPTTTKTSCARRREGSLGPTRASTTRRGAYTKFGTIERLSRLLDLDHEGWLFAETDPFAHDDRKARLLALSERSFAGFDEAERLAFLQSARRWEAITRHKMNPNCPSYGTRESLMAAGILSNEIPEGL